MNPQEQYYQKLTDPRWRAFRLAVLEAAGFACENCRQHSTVLVAHHRQYKPGCEPWEYPLEAMACLCDRCHNDVHEVAPCPEVAAIVAAFAARKSFPTRLKKPDFDAGRVWAWLKTRVQSGPPQRAMMKFAHWLWNTGTQDMELVLELLAEGLRKNPESWYAYFAPGSTARTCRHDQRAITEAERESEAHKAADRAFLAGGSHA